MPDQNDQNNQNQPPVQPVFADPTQMGDASSVPPATTQPAQPSADATAGNQPVVQEVAPQATTVSSMKPTRGKIGPKGIIATVFGLLLLAGAVVAGTTLVQQNQDIRERAASCNPESYNECCGPGLSRSVTRSCDAAGNASYNTGGCSQNDSACGAPAPQPVTCGAGYQYQNGSCVCVSPTGCGQTSPGGTTAPAQPTPTPSSTTTPTGGSHAGACTAAELAQGTGFTTCNASERVAFGTCPSQFCAAGNQAEGCAGAAKVLGCYTPGTNDTSQCYLYRHYKCANQNYTTFLNEGCNAGGVTSSSLPSLTQNYCGGQQIDCCYGSDSNCQTDRVITTSFKNCSQAVATASPSTPPGTPPPGGTTTSASCQNIKAYDENWVQLTAQDLSALNVGDTVRFAVKGSATSGSFGKARFTINGVLRPEVTTTNPSDPQQFYDVYTIPAGVSTFTIKSEIHHTQLNSWKG